MRYIKRDGQDRVTESPYCRDPGHQYGEHDVSCVPRADPADSELRFLRAIFGLCPDCGRTDSHAHPAPVAVWVHQLCQSCLKGSCGSCSARTVLSTPCLCRHAYRVLVTGSRTWDLAEAVCRQLDLIEAKAWRLGHRAVTVVQGGARGPDRHGIMWTQRPSPFGGSCGDRPMLRVHETHRPVWNPCGGSYDPRAAHKRNVRMAELGAHEYVAFADMCAKDSCPQRGQHWSHGTADQIEICETAGIPGMPHDRLEAQVMLEFGGGSA